MVLQAMLDQAFARDDISNESEVTHYRRALEIV